MNNRLSENEKAFIECFSRFVNGQMGSAAKVGNALADDHRYLINEKGKVVFAFLERLANDVKVDGSKYGVDEIFQVEQLDGFKPVKLKSIPDEDLQTFLNRMEKK